MLSRRLGVVLASALCLPPLLIGCSSETPAGGDTPATGGGPATGGTGGSASGMSGSSTGGTTAGTSQGGAAGTAIGGSAGSVAGSNTGGSAGAGGSDTAGAGGAGAGGNGGAGGSASGAGGAGAGGASGAGGAGGGAGGAGGKGGAAGASGAAGKGGGGAGGGSSFTVTTPAFTNMPGCGPGNMAAMCATFPRDNTNYGTNVSPAMSWTGVPSGTQSFAVLLQDLTNTMAHWVIWNIPANVTSLPENIPKMAMPGTPAGAQQCSYQASEGYAGPGACGNVYEFVVYALSIPTFSPTQATDQQRVRMQLQALGSQILGTATMRARSFAPNCP